MIAWCIHVRLRALRRSKQWQPSGLCQWMLNCLLSSALPQAHPQNTARVWWKQCLNKLQTFFSSLKAFQILQLRSDFLSSKHPLLALTFREIAIWEYSSCNSCFSPHSKKGLLLQTWQSAAKLGKQNVPRVRERNLWQPGYKTDSLF